jgi:glycosyltransferase involved in cell wall biosynthesis
MLIGAYYPERSGGGLQCRTLVNALKESVAFIILTTTRQPDLPRRGHVDGVPVHRVPVRRQASPLAAVRLVRAFMRVRSQIDIVHFHGFTTKMLAVYVLARLFGKPILEKPVSVGGDDPITMGRGFPGRVFSRADRFVSISPGMTARFRASRIPLAKVREIPNGVDLDRFRPPHSAAEVANLRAELGLPAGRPIIVSVGFFSRDKAPHVLFEAWRRLADRPYLLFIGSTNPAHVEVDSGIVRAIKDEIRTARLEHCVGFVEDTDRVEEYLRASDVFASASRREGLPNALLEAMASGLAIVACRIEGVTTSLIRDGETGFLFPPDDPNALAGRLALVLGDQRLRGRLGAAAREAVAAGLGIHMVAAKYLDLYRELLGVGASA